MAGHDLVCSLHWCASPWISRSADSIRTADRGAEDLLHSRPYEHRTQSDQGGNANEGCCSEGQHQRAHGPPEWPTCFSSEDVERDEYRLLQQGEQGQRCRA
jgi:hypothetical protein